MHRQESENVTTVGDGIELLHVQRRLGFVGHMSSCDRSVPSFLIEAKRQSSASSGQVTFSGKVVSMVIHCVPQQLLQLRNVS